MLSSVNKLLSQLADNTSIHNNHIQHRKYGSDNKAVEVAEINSKTILCDKIDRFIALRAPVLNERKCRKIRHDNKN